jgi:hypothetical protein
MLANALFYVALLAMAAMTVLSAGLAMTRMTQVRIAQSYLSGGYQRAVASLQEGIAAQIQSGVAPNPMPAFTPLPGECADAATVCAYRTSATITFTAANVALGASCDPSRSSCAQNEQANRYVNENRIPARISVFVTGPGGAELATRTTDVLLRTIATAPYVVIAGARDGTFDDVASSHATGDDGGTPPATPDPCSSNSPGVADDTAIRVAYQNAATNRCTNGSSWRSSSYDTPAESSAGWSP